MTGSCLPGRDGCLRRRFIPSLSARRGCTATSLTSRPAPPDARPGDLARWRILLLICCLLGAAGCQPGEKPPPRPRRVGILTSRADARPVALVVAPDGRAAASITANGKFTMVGPGGQARFERDLPGAFTASIANSGRAAIAGGKDSQRYWVRIITERGRIRWRQSVTGTLLTVAITPDGQAAFASTTGGNIYAFTLSGRLRWNRITTQRDISALTYSETADALLVETTNPCGFGMIGIDGRTRWWHGRPVGHFTLVSGGRGSLVVTTLASMAPSPSVRMTALTPAGRELFAREFEGYEPRAAISSDGSQVALSYRRKLVHKGKSVMERRVELWNRDGKTLWREGGLFFKPVLAGMQEDPPGVLIAEDYSLLSALDRNGRLAWRGPALRGALVRLTHDEGWRLGWADYEDGSFELWRLGR